MGEWKQALWLAKFEIKASVQGILLLFAMTLGLSLFFTSVFSGSVLEAAPLVFDVFFLLTFWMVAASFRPKEFQLKKIGGDTWASPYFIMLNQLPITKNVLVMSRFISYFIVSIPFHVLVLTLIYAFSSEYRDVLPIASYLVFSIIWISFGIACGAMFPAGDAGEKMSTTKLVVFNILLWGGLLAILIAINIIYNQGIVAWTMYAAKEWPFTSTAVSIIVVIGNLLYYKGYMYKKIDKVDYLK